MAHLNDLQVAFISEEIRQRGIDLRDLHDDLLDHICTSIESRMEGGENFESAYEQTIKLFGPGGLMQVQEQTLFLLTQMNETMKKFSTGFGLASTALLLAGMFFKIKALPGAGIMMVLGNFFLVFFYLPVMFIHKWRESVKDDRPGLVSGFLGLGVFAAGVTFKIMHWPFANMMLWSGFLLLVLVFMPVYFIRRYRSSANKSVTLTSAMLVFIGSVQIGQLLNLRNSTQYHHAVTAMNVVMEENLKSASDNAQLRAFSAQDPVAVQLLQEAEELNSYVEELKQKLIVHCLQIGREEASKMHFYDVNRKEYFDEVSEVMIGSYDHPRTDEYSAIGLRNRLDAFRQSVLTSYDENMRSVIEPTLGFKTNGTYTSVRGEEQTWELYYFHMVTLGAAVTHLTEIQWEALQMANQRALLHTIQSETPGSPSPEI